MLTAPPSALRIIVLLLGAARHATAQLTPNVLWHAFVGYAGVDCGGASSLPDASYYAASIDLDTRAFLLSSRVPAPSRLVNARAVENVNAQPAVDRVGGRM